MSMRRRSKAEETLSRQEKVLLDLKKRRCPCPHRPIRYKTNFRNIILKVFKDLEWKACEDDMDWDIIWADREWMRDCFDVVHLHPHQRVNHFRNGYEITRKDLLIKNLKRSKRALIKGGHKEEASQYDFFPKCFAVPQEHSLFVEEFKRVPNTNWIMKPVGRCQGKGIFIVNKLKQVDHWKRRKMLLGVRDEDGKPGPEPYIIQRYIDNPLLIGGKKFDLRVYCLVTSFVPLVCYLYRSGFSRFTTAKYTNDSRSMDSAIVHLTNVAIQKHSVETSGLKWDLRKLKLYLIARHGRDRVNKLFEQMQLLIIRTLLSAQKLLINDKHCFEVYGFDILVDDKLAPWLLEVNSYPSVSATTREDYNLKYALLIDTMEIVDLEGKYTGNECQIGGYDLIYRGGVVKFESQCVFSSNMGGNNPSIGVYGERTGAQWRSIQTLMTNENKIEITSRHKAKPSTPIETPPICVKSGTRKYKATVTVTKRKSLPQVRTSLGLQRSKSKASSSVKQRSKSTKEPYVE